ncbi:hypothetical protein T484DRAFT_2963856 [Baffinella frigidus]|nr:hypothetical protein T484DRAFT_2963856 [Cryptophyta sp. CCMP2293]
MEHHHRSALKQANKKFKAGSKSSKRAQSRTNCGKVNNVKGGGGTAAESSRTDRLNKARQGRDEHRKLQASSRRGVGGVAPPPRLIVLLSVTKNGLTGCVRSAIFGRKADEMDKEDTVRGPETGQLPGVNQRVTVIEAPRNMLAVLDLMMVADIFVLVAGAGEEQDALGGHLLHAAKLFGTPQASLMIVQGASTLASRPRQVLLEKWKTTAISSTGRDTKVVGDRDEDTAVMQRFLAHSKVSARPTWAGHGMVLAHSVQQVAPAAAGGEEGGKEMMLGVTGYVRGKALTPDQLMHVPAQGTYTVDRVVVHADPHVVGREEAKMGSEETLAPTEGREGLAMEQEVDEMDAEQTWPTAEELQGAKRKKRVPKGMDPFLAAWIVDDESGSEEGEEEEGEEGEGGADGLMRGSGSEEEEEEEEEWEDEEDEEESEDGMDADAEAADAEGFLARRRAATEESDFPDEVDTPVDMPARTRFQKYRGLKSFRSSPWDPLENLPSEYAKIAHFRSLNASRLRAVAEDPNSAYAPVGAYVTVWFSVPAEYAESAVAKSAAGEVLVVGALQRYENSMAAMHYNVTRAKDDGDVIRSKDTLVVICGLRRFEAQPIFSEDRHQGDKHKILRFLPPRGSCCASLFAPVAWAPAPVLLCRRHKSGAMTVVAAGSCVGPRANRITLKRLVITALPLKLKKRKATCRFMFFNPDDVRWFKPVELWTKEGRRGHIKESLGTHGYMKCTFDAPIQHSDTVCMSLYKRVFPPYPEDPTVQLDTLGGTPKPLPALPAPP